MVGLPVSTMKWSLHLLVFSALAILVNSRPNQYGIQAETEDVDQMHPTPAKSDEEIDHPRMSMAPHDLADLDDETSTAFWNHKAQATLREHINKPHNTNKAKNLILLMGDGMSIPTLMAARTYLGQLHGNTGEEESLYWERFPYAAYSKTYCVDYQVADSSCTATAYFSGVKTNMGTVGMNARVRQGDCDAMNDTSNFLTSIAQWAMNSGKSAGFVTNTRVTHASPACLYGNSADRYWESDADVTEAGFDPNVCQDLATQLIRTRPGIDFKVILGGGRREFLPNTTIDDEGTFGRRQDGVDLIEAWKQDKSNRGGSHKYVWNRRGLRNVIDNPEDYDYVLGLFEDNHCPYNLEANPETEPTLSEMTEAAIKILEKNPNGYYLFVEGGRIDHAHHENWATIALDETVDFAKAVRVADRMSNENDTLLVVTADHAHVMSISGYPFRGTDIRGIGGVSYIDDLPYTTLSYANGPGYKWPINDTRYDITNDDFRDIRYRYPTAVPLSSETHGGDDVPIFARGPWSHLFSGTLEQNTIPHFMAYAACIGSGLTACTRQQN